MKTVLQPLNEKAAKIVTEHADLLEGSSVEPLLLQLVAHVSAYRVILERQNPLTPMSMLVTHADLIEDLERRHICWSAGA